ncbi:CubicO group peptidase (beta-lactamase class C family) [Umezawaea tangerina]|uniref:CubicO group peptidase (Beta-lactamase class C family) n=1 Tax=Umezawaea tangerina TaxID=84725 RepID=A0A2T0SQI4_9PSEU|nr:CubicO group peptidase (beta-lactamase class C family) [Umezawaea tangerina]
MIPAVQRLAEFVEAEVAADRLPGAVVGVVHRGREVFFEAFGFRDRARGVAMTTDSLFWVASMSKPITAAAALLLVERGRLALGDPIGAYLPQFAGRSVQPTVLDLLRHTAGMPEGLLGDSPVHELYADAVGDGMTDLTGAEFVDRLSRLPLLHVPGAVWHYGWGVDLVGLIIESLVGTSLGDFLRDEVCGPLGMTDTTFGVPDGHRDRFARPSPPHVLPDLSVARFHSGGAGLVSTAGDYLRFVRMLLAKGEPLLGRKTVEYMLSDQLAPGTDTSRLERPGWNPGHGFGIGLAVRRRVGGVPVPGSVGEVTWPGAGGTTWWADPSEDLGVVVMAHTTADIEPRIQGTRARLPAVAASDLMRHHPACRQRPGTRRRADTGPHTTAWRGQTWFSPPSTYRLAPMTKLLSAEARNATAAATSAGSPTRPMAIEAPAWAVKSA